ncbi:MAG: hypothetical protein JWR19_1747 [Pedosphaera sp.]|nr:hypothetical protein [Pedosphaera sp.]
MKGSAEKDLMTRRDYESAETIEGSILSINALQGDGFSLAIGAPRELEQVCLAAALASENQEWPR